jgi:hypothetical protein
MIPLLATIIDGLIIGGCVLVVCFGLIYILFFREKMQGRAGALDKGLPASTAISDAEYELITERLMQIEGKYTIVLLAATSVNCLPITIPVNVGVSLAQSGRRCLLIDTDIKRNAIAKAFEVDEQAGSELNSPREHKTSFDNLRLWPAHNFAHKNALVLADVVERARNEFDFVIISAPNLGDRSNQTQIAAASDCAFIFAQNADDATKLSSLMKPAKCSIIGNVKVSPS